MTIDLIEYGMFNPPPGMEQWRCYRIEYGGHARECLAEGLIWLPSHVDPVVVETLLRYVQDPDTLVLVTSTDRQRVELSAGPAGSLRPPEEE